MNYKQLYMIFRGESFFGFSTTDKMSNELFSLSRFKKKLFTKI